MKRIFILDTNVLLYDPYSIFRFQDDDDLVIPLIVIEEMDNQKRREDEIGRNARRFAELLDKLRYKGKIHEGVKLENGGNLKVEVNHQSLENLSGGLQQYKTENQVLAVAVAYQQEFPDRRVIILTKDAYFRIKSDVLGIEAEDYKNEDISEFYQDGEKIINYDVALSFAGEDREYVEQVAKYLLNEGIKVFYDKFEEVTLWGKNLIDHLADVYSNRSRFVVMFVSKYYKEKVWPNHERQNAQSKALKVTEELILPVRFDDTNIPGLPDTIGYLDLRSIEPDKLAEMIIKKIYSKPKYLV